MVLFTLQGKQMPIFDYKCPKCEITTERMVKKAEEEVQCRVCQTTMAKLVSAPAGFILKGAGFYKNDSTVDELRRMEKQSNALKGK